MIAALLFCLTAQTSEFRRPEPLFPQVFQQPTGRNGFEDYIRAADVVHDGQFGAAWEVVRAISNGQRRPERMPAWLSAAETPLEMRRLILQRYGRALDLMTVGHTKPAFDPRTINSETLFTELAPMRNLGRLASIRARTEFASGNPNGAVAAWANGLTMANRIPTSSLITSLVKIAIKSELLADVQSQLSLVSESGLRQLEIVATNVLSDNDMNRAVKQEALFVEDYLRRLNQNDEPIDDDLDTDATREFLKLPRPERDWIAQRVRDLVERDSRQILDRLSLPESEWDFTDLEQEIPESAPLERRLVGDFTPLYSQFAAAVARIRTQFRLLKLHASVQRFRWHFDRLPKSLAEAGVSDARCPLSQKPFVFELQGDSYTLASEGGLGSGRIELRYTRPRGQTGAGEP